MIFYQWKAFLKLSADKHISHVVVACQEGQMLNTYCNLLPMVYADKKAFDAVQSSMFCLNSKSLCWLMIIISTILHLI